MRTEVTGVNDDDIDVRAEVTEVNDDDIDKHVAGTGEVLWDIGTCEETIGGGDTAKFSTEVKLRGAQ